MQNISPYLTSALDITIFFIHPDSKPKTAFTCPYGKFQWKRVAFDMQTAPSIFWILMLKLFFKYWDIFLVFWMDDLLIYSQTKEKLETSVKLKMSMCEFFKKEIEYLGHLVSGQGISPMKQKIKPITELAPATNIPEA